MRFKEVKVSPYIAIHFGWILTFPLWGPVLDRVASNQESSHFTLGLLFLLGTATCYLILRKLKWTFAQENVKKCILGVSFSVLLFFYFPITIYFILFITGIFSAVIVFYGFQILLAELPRESRGQAIALAILLANANLYAFIQLSSLLPNYLIFIWIMLLAIGPLLLIKNLQIAVAEQEDNIFANNKLPYVFFLFFIALFFGVGSLISEQLFAALSLDPLSIVERNSLIPYILAITYFVFLKYQVGLFSFLACLVLFGIGIVIHYLGQGIIFEISAAWLSMTAIALADLFLWTFLAQQKKILAYNLFCLAIPAQLLAIAIFSIISIRIPDENYLLGFGAISLFIALIPLYLSFNLIEESQKQNDNNLQNNDMEVATKQLFSSLTKRESEVLELLIKGYSNETIAETMYISITTVRSHLKNIYRKTGFTNRNAILSWLVTVNNNTNNNI